MLECNDLKLNYYEDFLESVFHAYFDSWNISWFAIPYILQVKIVAASSGKEIDVVEIVCVS